MIKEKAIKNSKLYVICMETIYREFNVIFPCAVDKGERSNLRPSYPGSQRSPSGTQSHCDFLEKKKK